ncbi:MAG: hypothetical protein P1U86_16735 [Verrucomicrobiales bacterium]|nr:hypothetical protein [Verrucomicrobiales bacterium]
MWNSPYSESENGRKFSLEEIAALVVPLAELLDTLSFRSVFDTIDEPILQRLERDELIFALYEVLHALLEDDPVPEGGFPGIQEAMIAELLNQAHGSVVCEMETLEWDFAETEMSADAPADYARAAVWKSVDRLLIHEEGAEPFWPLVLEEAGMKPTDPAPHLSEKMTPEIWEELLMNEDLLLSAFVEDTDWRMEFLMDVHPDAAKKVSQLVGLDLEVVQALPHTPDAAELEKAERYIREVIRKGDAIFRGTEKE